jgi:hypothetical protein
MRVDRYGQKTVMETKLGNTNSWQKIHVNAEEFAFTYVIVLCSTWLQIPYSLSLRINRSEY